MQAKHQFYHKGPDNQKRADVTVDLKRVSAKDVAKWTPEEKMELIKWMNTMDNVFKVFRDEIFKISV